MRRYETILIIDPEISDENRDLLFDRVRSIIDQNEGLLVIFDEWGTRKLAYEIKKRVRGLYLRLDYCGTGALVDEIERFSRIDDRVLKYMSVLLDKSVDLEKAKEEAALAEAARKEKAERERGKTDSEEAAQAAVDQEAAEPVPADEDGADRDEGDQAEAGQPEPDQDETDRSEPEEDKADQDTDEQEAPAPVEADAEAKDPSADDPPESEVVADDAMQPESNEEEEQDG